MALTLLEAAKIALGRDEIAKATIMELYAKSSQILDAIRWDNISGNALKFNREKSLPNAGFRGVNEGYTEGTGQVDPIIESLCIAGGDLDVDKFLVDTAGNDQRTIQEGLKVKALAGAMTKQIVKGSVLTDPKGFDGLQVRSVGDQLIAAGATASGDALSLTKLDELIDQVDDATHLIMNKTMRRRLIAAARNPAVGGDIQFTLDNWGARVTSFNGLPITVVEKDETYTEIMPFTEVCPGGGSNLGTSIYCVSITDDGFTGLQNGEMDVRDLGELEDKPVYRTRVEWYVTIAAMRERSISRLYGIKDAAVTA